MLSTSSFCTFIAHFLLSVLTVVIKIVVYYADFISTKLKCSWNKEMQMGDVAKQSIYEIIFIDVYKGMLLKEYRIVVYLAGYIENENQRNDGN